MEFNIKKLKFQLTQPVPETLSCLVKSTHDGQPLVLLDLVPYIKQFYEQGKTYSFRVKADYTRSNFYEVEDDFGFFFRLPATATSLRVGQTVDCRVTEIKECIVKLKLQSTTGDVRKMPSWSLQEIKEKVYGNERTPFWLRRFILSASSLPFREEYQKEDTRWLLNAINHLIDEIPTWFQEPANTDHTLVTGRIENLRHVSQTLLEGCDYLTKYSDNERLSYRNQFSEMTSTLNNFLRACSMLKEGNYKEFVNKMFNNLKSSGYLYNPDKQFHTFNAILRIHPEFIHDWMGQIFDALTSWGIENWKTEPFRSAFVRQAELYIRENQDTVDELVTFKFKKDNAIISKMIMAIAIQMLIIEEDKDNVDIDRNRAMFYRYVSYLKNTSQNTLLDKAFRCIMGCRFKPEFTWKELRQLEMLLTLASVDSIEKTGENKLRCACTIVDDAYEGHGFLNIRNIVRYGCEPSISDFRDEETDQRLIYEASVQGVNQRGELAFNMLEQVDHYIEECVGYGDESRCVITSKQELTFMCLSEFGYSIIITRDETTAAYDTGQFVMVEVIEAPAANKIRGCITGRVDATEHFKPSLPIHNILQDIYVDVEEAEITEDDDAIQAEEAITYEQVEELIAIIRRFAFSSADYVEAYNYLGFAHVLAKMVSHKELMNLCHEHMELLILLQSFAKNRCIDVAEVEKHASSATCNPMLKMLYTRLFVVSSIGRPEYDNKLWDMLETVESEEDANLMRKVLSLNLLEQSSGLDDTTQKAVLEQIGQILKLNFHQSNLKFYGTESQYVEFKTSIVFPADNHMKPDVDRQNYEIASIICGFLNADGGTLYIGVNDQGYECGVNSDMKYYKVTNMDKYILKIENMIEKMLGSTANDYTTIEQDTGCKQNVVVVKIRPSLRVVAMKHDNRVYVRHTTSTRPKVGEDLEIFKKDREIRYRQISDSQK